MLYLILCCTALIYCCGLIYLESISFYENNIMTDSVHVLFTKYDFPILNLVISQFSDLASFYDLHLSSNLIPKKLNVFYYFDNLFII